MISSETRCVHAFVIIAFTEIAICLVVLVTHLLQIYLPYPSLLQAYVSGTIIALPAFIYRYIKKEDWDLYGFSEKNVGFSIALGSVLVAVVVISWFFVRRQSFFTQPLPYVVRVVLYYFIMAFEEEFIFRGFFQTALVNSMGALDGVLFSSVIFSLSHIPQRMVLDGMTALDAITSSWEILWFALLMGYVAYKCKNIYACILLHTLYNVMGSV